MAKKWLIGAGIAVAAIGLVVGGAAFAASTAAASGPAAEVAASALMPMMLGRMAGLADDAEPPVGLRGRLHAYMLEEVAAALSLTSEELQAELAGGRTLAAIAEEQGVAGDEFTQLLKDAWTKALSAAVADGVLTQEQADWLADHPLLARYAGGRIHRPRGRAAMGWGTFGQGWLNDDAGLAEGTVNG